MQVARTSEVNQYLHNPVKAMNFAVDDIYVSRRVRIKLLQFISKQLQVENDGIDRILYLMGNATSHASAGRNTAREFNLIFNTAGRFGVAHLPAEIRDCDGDLPVFVVSGGRLQGRSIRLSHAVEAAADVLQRSESQI